MQAAVFLVILPLVGLSSAPPDPQAEEHAPWRLELKPPDDRSAARTISFRARLFRALRETPVTVSFDETPMRSALRALGDQLPVSVIGRWNDDPLGYGLDPDVSITLAVRSGSALDVLEQILEICSHEQGVACTWQIRRGFIEVGTKARLSVPAARETRLYHIADLIMEIPQDVDHRTRREVIALEIVGEIVENVEPGVWDYGQEDPPVFDEEFEPSQPQRAVTPPPAPPTSGTDEAPQESRLVDPHYTAYIPPRHIARIRYWRDVMIIDAPDYIHRQIAGYDEPTISEARGMNEGRGF